MYNQDYNAIIIADITPIETFNRINKVSEWWSENITGRSENLGDVFTVHFQFGDSFTIRIIDMETGKKIVWLVTDCDLTWVADKQEWKNTKMWFEISNVNNSSRVSFTHIGLVPHLECFNGCKDGWDHFIKGSLFKFLSEGKGEPDLKI